jgi:hypothetical protein
MALWTDKCFSNTVRPLQKAAISWENWYKKLSTTFITIGRQFPLSWIYFPLNWVLQSNDVIFWNMEIIWYQWNILRKCYLWENKNCTTWSIIQQSETCHKSYVGAAAMVTITNQSYQTLALCMRGGKISYILWTNNQPYILA